MRLVTLNNRAVRSVTTFGSVGNDSMVFIKKLTASSSSTLSFVDGSSDVVFDGTYKKYRFFFTNIHPATDNVDLTFNFSTDNGSNYNVTKTSTFFFAFQNEAGSATALNYEANSDLAQSTAFQPLTKSGIGNASDESGSGYLDIFNPSSTTYVKHFIGRLNHYVDNNFTLDNFPAGYANTTSAIDAVQFKFSSGNIDSGTISLYGIS